MSAVIDRIVEQNNALWELLTDHSLTDEQKLIRVNRAFPSAALVKARRMRDESSWGTTSYSLWNEEVKRLERAS